MKGLYLLVLIFWYGKLLNDWVNEWVFYWIKDNGNFVMLGMEDLVIL